MISVSSAKRTRLSRALRGKMGIEERVPEICREALRARKVLSDFPEFKAHAQTAMEKL